MLTKLIVLLFFAFPATHAPLPALMLSAKTIYIDNRTSHANLGDRAYDELKKWGRYRIVTDPNGADLIFLLTAATYVTGSYHHGTHTDDSYSSTSTTTRAGVTYLHVIDPRDGQLLWSDSRKWGVLLQGFRSATRALIKTLRERVEEQSPARP